MSDKTPLDHLEDNGDFFGLWIDYSRNDVRFQASQILEAMTYFDLSEEELVAYDAPFPARIFMGGPRAFPGIVNQLPGVTDAAWEGLGEFDKPFLTIWHPPEAAGCGESRPPRAQRRVRHRHSDPSRCPQRRTSTPRRDRRLSCRPCPHPPALL